MSKIVKVENKGITLQSVEEVKIFLKLFGYGQAQYISHSQYRVDKIGEPLPAITIVRSE